jgi:hypothetical protein
MSTMYQMSRRDRRARSRSDRVALLYLLISAACLAAALAAILFIQ